MFKKLFLAVLFSLFFSTIAYADCTGCGDDGHAVCPVEAVVLFVAFKMFINRKGVFIICL